MCVKSKEKINNFLVDHDCKWIYNRLQTREYFNSEKSFALFQIELFPVRECLKFIPCHFQSTLQKRNTICQLQFFLHYVTICWNMLLSANPCKDFQNVAVFGKLALVNKLAGKSKPHWNLIKPNWEFADLHWQTAGFYRLSSGKSEPFSLWPLNTKLIFLMWYLRSVRAMCGHCLMEMLPGSLCRTGSTRCVEDRLPLARVLMWAPVGCTAVCWVSTEHL